MGRTRTPKYVVELKPQGHGIDYTAMEWRVHTTRTGGQGYGKPSVENLVRFIEDFNAALDGVNSHVKDAYGDDALVVFGRIRDNHTRDILVEVFRPIETTVKEED